MGANDDIHNVKRTHLNCFQMHTIFEQIGPKPATYSETPDFF